MSDTVLTQLEDSGVLRVTLNRPKSKNAFNIEQWNRFRDVLSEATDNPAVACLLITGAGQDFSSGTDLTEMGDSGEEHPFEKTARALVDFDKPIVAAAKGVAVGGGATLLLHTDVIFVRKSLRMRFPFVNLGLVPEWGSSVALAAMVGSRRAAELMYTARWLNGDDALEAGIATAVYDDDELEAQALATAESIAQWPVSSLVATKRLMRRELVADSHAAIDAEQKAMYEIAGSPENIEAIMAFMEKRDPDFKQFRR